LRELLFTEGSKNMAFNRFSLSVVIRVVILTMTILILCYLLVDFSDRERFFIFLVLLLFITVQTLSLIYYVSRTNRELSRFLAALQDSDYTVKVQDDKLQRSFKELAGIIDRTMESLRDMRLEKEMQEHLLKLITADIKIGLLTVNNKDRIVLMNHKAQDLLGSDFQTWGQLKLACPSFASEVETTGTDGNRFTGFNTNEGVRKISLSVSTITTPEESIRIITLEDIQTQVEMKESDARLKLIRILMHEVMNSVTPLTSLTETIVDILRKRSPDNKLLADTADENIKDIMFCIENIQNRKNHLMNFIGNYQRLTHLPVPDKKEVRALDLVNSVAACMQSELTNSNTDLLIDSGLKDMVLMADASQVEQVLINIIKNSIQAMDNSKIKLIHIRGFEKDSYSVIEIEDTGEGIQPEHLEDIFIPFFTTKPNGSGIGLGLSRQIMIAHNGFIRVHSAVNEGSCFLLWFEKVTNVHMVSSKSS
jgi:two-component system nitrogen regulation sensor histidine kinase NtrY